MSGGHRPAFVVLAPPKGMRHRARVVLVGDDEKLLAERDKGIVARVHYGYLSRAPRVGDMLHFTSGMAVFTSGCGWEEQWSTFALAPRGPAR